MSGLNIPDLIGVTIDPSRSVLSEQQVVRLGALLLRLRPADTQSVAFVGGRLSGLADAATTSSNGTSAPQSLGETLGSDPFLVIAGSQGAVALLSVPTPQGYATRIFTDPERVDRAALVLAQFGDVPYELNMAPDLESQRALAMRVVLTLLTDEELQHSDLATLLHDEHNWLRLARLLADHPDPATVLNLPAVQQVIRACGGQRVLAGALDASRTLRVLAANDTTAPLQIAMNTPALSGLLQALRPGSVAPSAWQGDGAVWVQQSAVTLIPLARKQALWGVLLVTSERPLPVSARATLQALGVLLHSYLSAHPVAAPVPRPAVAAPVAASGAAIPAALRSPLTSRLAAERSPVATRPATPRAPAGEVMSTLLNTLDEGVVLVNSTGALADFNAAAAQLLSLQPQDRNRALAETAARDLVPLLTEALLGETVQRQPLYLNGGDHLLLSVVALPGERWACVLHQPVGTPAAPVTSAGDDDWLPSMPGAGDPAGDYNESLLAGFSNSIRGPLHSLRELIARVPAAGQLNEQQSMLIGQVVQLNTELTLLVNDLLTLGQVRYQMAEMSGALRIDMLVEAAIGTRYAEFGRRGQRVATEFEPNVPRVVGSEEGLGRVIGALLDNAILYTPPGSEIIVRIGQQGQNLVVHVEDNGPGLEPEEAARVFEPFYRAPLAEQLGVQGRGLGLTIARAVIEHHHGRIWVESVPGQGCMFAFSLPCDTESV